MKNLISGEPVQDHSERPLGVGDHLPDTTLVGSLFFEGGRHGVRTSSGAVLLHMPDFSRYAYFEGIKPEAQVKVCGHVQHSKVKGEHSVMHAREVTVGTKTFHGYSDASNLLVHPNRQL